MNVFQLVAKFAHLTTAGIFTKHSFHGGRDIRLSPTHLSEYLLQAFDAKQEIGKLG